MLTFFTTAKPFRGHDAIIQRNALKSWTLLPPDVEVILLGDEKGAAEAAKEPGLGHEPHVERNEFGAKRLDFMFRRSQADAFLTALIIFIAPIIAVEDYLNDPAAPGLQLHEGLLAAGLGLSSSASV